MRITNSIIRRQAIQTFQTNLRKLDEAQSQVTTGLKLQKVSDDPTAARQDLATTGSLRALDQYKRNIQSAGNRASAEEGVLDQLTTVLTRAKELGVSQGTATANATTRQAAKAEVDQLLEHAVGLGNSKFGDAYLFGGEYATAAPIDRTVAPWSTQSPTQRPKVEIASGQYMDANHNATEVFLNTGALAALKELSDALGSDDATAVRTSLTSLDTAFDGVQSLTGDIGARSNQLQIASANLEALGSSLTAFKSDLEEVDLEKAMTDLVGRQTAYQAAMLATSKVLGMNLTDYLR